MRRDRFEPSKHSKLCSSHFEETCFDPAYRLKMEFGMEGKQLRRRLKSEAVPTIFNFSGDDGGLPVKKRGANKKRQLSGTSNLATPNIVSLLTSLPPKNTAETNPDADPSFHQQKNRSHCDCTGSEVNVVSSCRQGRELQISSQSSPYSPMTIKEEPLFTADENGCDQRPEVQISSQSFPCSRLTIKEEPLFTANENSCDQGPGSSQSFPCSPMTGKEEPLFPSDQNSCDQGPGSSQSFPCSPMTGKEEPLFPSDQNSCYQGPGPSQSFPCSPMTGKEEPLFPSDQNSCDQGPGSSQSFPCSPMTSEEETLIITDENGCVIDKIILTSHSSSSGENRGDLTEETCGVSQSRDTELCDSGTDKGHMARKPLQSTSCEDRGKNKRSREKPLECDWCDYRCDHRSHLTVHVRTHTGEKPFRCTWCDYRSSQSSALTMHTRTHTGEKPFMCTFCDYKCKRKPDLMKHVRTHTLKKYFQCTWCNFSCHQKGTLTKHIRSHIREKLL